VPTNRIRDNALSPSKVAAGDDPHRQDRRRSGDRREARNRLRRQRSERFVRAGNGWRVFGKNVSGGDSTITAFAYCLAD